VPGDGAIDFVSVLQAVRDICYNGWVTVELYPYVDDPDRAARTALERVRDYSARVGVHNVAGA
jgi:sugar phosphate isomerase/epimerase